jgi:hypothetical protein
MVRGPHGRYVRSFMYSKEQTNDIYKHKSCASGKRVSEARAGMEANRASPCLSALGAEVYAVSYPARDVCLAQVVLEGAPAPRRGAGPVLMHDALMVGAVVRGGVDARHAAALGLRVHAGVGRLAGSARVDVATFRHSIAGRGLCVGVDRARVVGGCGPQHSDETGGEVLSLCVRGEDV